VLILDEATSALDVESEFLVQQALERLVEGRTTFIVAHRLSTIRNASRIVVLEHGKIVEMGTLEELLARKGKFSKMHSLQAAGKN
jgi:ABC-type multidrug transport system fused ATPase/permease subunit